MSFDGLSHIFDTDKTVFLNDVERSIRSYIIGTGKQCIAIVEKIPKSTGGYAMYKHELHLDSNLPEFAEVLIKFIRRKRHDGHDLDSALTEPVLGIIEEKYVALYNSHIRKLGKVRFSNMTFTNLSQYYNTPITFYNRISAKCRIMVTL